MSFSGILTRGGCGEICNFSIEYGIIGGNYIYGCLRFILF